MQCVIKRVINVDRYLKVVSLFSGCGGMDLGFRGDFFSLGNYYPSLPFDIVFANDISDKACLTYQKNFHHKAVCQSIGDLDYNTIPKADVVLGGFPCQDFSVAGKRRGLTAERGRLYLHMIQVVHHSRPSVFVAENVDGIRSSKISNNTALTTIIGEFEKIGYKVGYKIVNAANFGVPQNRTRVIIVGIREDIRRQMNYPIPTHSNDDLSMQPLVTSRDAIDDLWFLLDDPSVDSHSSAHYSKAKFYPNKKLQGNRQIVADKPAPTIRAEHHGNIEAHYRSFGDSADMSKWRRLTVRECARLQSFPDNFHFPTSASASYVQVGNAVPPVLAWHIANAVYHSVFSA